MVEDQNAAEYHDMLQLFMVMTSLVDVDADFIAQNIFASNKTIGEMKGKMKKVTKLTFHVTC